MLPDLCQVSSICNRFTAMPIVLSYSDIQLLWTVAHRNRSHIFCNRTSRLASLPDRFDWSQLLGHNYDRNRRYCTPAISGYDYISVCRKLCIPWHSFLRLPHISFVWGIRKFNPTAPQLPKIEAIQTSLFVDVPDVLVTVFIRNASTSKSKSISMFLRYLAISFVWVIRHLTPHLLSYSNRWKWSYSEAS